MKEDFVTKGIAKKLKGKGFKEGCFGYYLPGGDILIFNYDQWRGGTYEGCLYSHNSLEEDVVGSDLIDVPTVSQVLKWLREVKGIDVLPQRGHINLDNNGKATRYYNVNIYFERRFACTLDNDEQDYSTYEQAAIAGIEYVIDNLI